MKKVTTVLTVLFLALFFGCTNEQMDDQSAANKKIKNSPINLPDETSDPNNDEHCVYTHLIAGQHHIAGSVTVDIVGDNLIITYTATGDWTIGTTHLSIGNCDEDWAPTTGSGNPQIGQFEYTEPFSVTPQEVVYVIPIADLGDNYCFAAHAEVDGPQGGETAWAEGSEFAGNSWAMFVEAFLSDCTPNDDDDDDDNGPT